MMPTNFSRVWKIGLATAATIVLGALGSGLWEAVLGPIVRHLGYWLLDAVSLGWQDYRASVYRDVARESSGIDYDTFSAVSFIFIGLWIALVAAHFSLYFLDKSLDDERRGELDNTNRNQSSPAFSLKRKVKSAVTRFAAHRAHNYIFAFMFIVVLTNQFIVIARDGYVRRAVLHYDRSLRVAAPYIDATSRSMIESRFAQIHDKNEYEEVVRELEQVARAHGQTVEEFKPW